MPGVAKADMSMLGLFLHADLVIQIIMVGLILASLWSWTIIFYKIFKMRELTRCADVFEEAFWSGGSLDDLYQRVLKGRKDPMSEIFCSAMQEWQRSASKSNRSTLVERIDRVMTTTLNRRLLEIERHMGFLASLGANAVIIGLFGTVVGIMISFGPIAAQSSATLATVAPAISEALFATAIGLVAAIPASIAYNKISTDIGNYLIRLENFVSDFGSIVARQLEER